MFFERLPGKCMLSGINILNANPVYLRILFYFILDLIWVLIVYCIILWEFIICKCLFCCPVGCRCCPKRVRRRQPKSQKAFGRKVHTSIVAI